MNNKTTPPNKSNFTREWHHLDAQDKVLGRFATQAAKILMGKNKAIFANNINVGDKVIITNANKIKVTGNKMQKKEYIWYTGYPKGLRTEKLKDRMARKPHSILRDAIKGMLPNNKLRKDRMRNLYIYTGATHPHSAQIKINESKIS